MSLQDDKEALVRAAAILYAEESVKFSKGQFVRLRPELTSDIWCVVHDTLMMFVEYIPKAHNITEDLRHPCNLLIIDCVVMAEDNFGNGIMALPMDSRYLELFKEDEIDEQGDEQGSA